uniref:kinesin-like protein KIN-14F n=1 Tax=Erigeron canadensis TaxID=72917 RepID=UPI001CB91574|nr:kinesin-like protein KIN-14F [Erigeron canadensis]
MPQQEIVSSNFHHHQMLILNSPAPTKNYSRGLLKGAEDFIDDRELAQRKAEAAAARRNQAAEWLRQMDHGAVEVLPNEPSEEHFCQSLRNGLILCNVLNKVNPGAIPKVVEIPVIDTEGAAQTAIQYFENTRNFLVAVGQMKLLTFEVSDLEKGGSSGKVVDCILCLKGYYEWRHSGGVGVWKYGGTVRITSFPKGSPSSLIGSESADESLDESESSQFEELLEYLHSSSEVSLEESKVSTALTFLFDRLSIGLLQAYLTETNDLDDFPLNSMVIDIVLKKAVKDLSALLVSQGNQLGIFLKNMLKGNCKPLSKHEFLQAISKYIDQRSGLVSNDFFKFCICGGQSKGMQHNINHTSDNTIILDLQQKQLEDLEARFHLTKLEIQQAHLTWEQELKKLVHHTKDLEVASSSYHKVLEENRQLYNQVQDLKGAIRVYCRVKPFTHEQIDEKSTVEYIGENGNIMIVNPHKQGKDARKIFTFNKVFGGNTTQEQIYVDTQPLIRSVLDGYNVCIFAYGQTGSGKTYTMSGPDMTTEDTWGVNYRALRDLFQLSEARKGVLTYEVGVQMIEIYNEQVRDLLVIDGSNRRLEIRNNSQLNGLNVPDASLVSVKCTQDVLDLMRIGHRNRAVGATALNERSSRSHSVLTVHIRGKELVSGSTLKGCLHLVDLAGSERVDKSEAVGERLKEAQHINRSLSALGDVISALAQKSTHIPYRNSKLTQVLQDSLGGHAKTLMFVHINPETNAIGETISTLKFAERVASIELGAAKSNKETGEIRDMKEEISNMKLLLEKKEAELEQLRRGNARGAISPVRMPRCNPTNTLRPDVNQHHLDENKIPEVRSCSSIKQRRPRYPSKFTDRESIPKLLAEEGSQSPPIRRSISTDRGAHLKSRIKPDTPDNLPITKTQYPTRAFINRSLATLASLPSTENKRGYLSSQDNNSEALHNLPRINARKGNQEQEEEQFKQMLNVRQGGIGKLKLENNQVKTKSQLPIKIHKADLLRTVYSGVDAGGTIEEGHRSDFSEPENEHVLNKPQLPVGMKKLQRSSSRSSHTVEVREPGHNLQSVMTASKNENKPLIGANNAHESSNASITKFRRSRSTPRGKFMVLP